MDGALIVHARSAVWLVSALGLVLLCTGCPRDRDRPTPKPGSGTPPSAAGQKTQICKSFTFEQGKLPRSLPRRLTARERAPLARIVEDPDNRGKLHARFRPAVSSLTFIKTIGLSRSTVVADIGAGTGALEIGVLEHKVPFGKIYAVDEIGGALRFLDYMLQATGYEGHRRIKTVVSAKQRPRLPAATLDKALIVNVMSFIFDRELYARKPEKKGIVRFLTALRRSLKPTGQIYNYKEMGDPPPGKATAPAVRSMPGPRARERWYRKMAFPLETAGFKVLRREAFMAHGVPYLLVVAK